MSKNLFLGLVAATLFGAFSGREARAGGCVVKFKTRNAGGGYYYNANGAARASAWLAGQEKGQFDMQDVLGLR